MPRSIIDELLELPSNERALLLQKTYKKNRSFFKKNSPNLHTLLEKKTCPYHIDLTSRFLNIIHTPTNTLAHPSAGLDHFARLMGDWVHDSWVDLFNIEVTIPMVDDNPMHTKTVSSFASFLNRKFPNFNERYSSGNINLKRIQNNKRFSPPVIYLGIFHGLHIAEHLSKTDISSILLFEPDENRFEVSCYFLDYEELKNRFGENFYLAIGPDSRPLALQHFFGVETKVTSIIWTRVLPGYVSEKFPTYIEDFKLLQKARNNIIYSLDNEIHGLKNGLDQLKKNRFLLSHDIKTSPQCNIAIIAAGPSLNDDLKWLKENQDNLIIFAVHSSVRVLTLNGIIPDFQFNLDYHTAPLKELLKLGLLRNKPLISYYKSTDEYFDLVEANMAYMVSDKNVANTANFKKSLKFTHPSTTSLSFSFAIFCEPQEIFMVGCDFGYKSVTQDHAKGSVYDDLKNKTSSDKTNLYGSQQQAMVSPNFIDSGNIQTNPFLSATRQSIELSIAKANRTLKVYNLSDGVKVKGSRPMHSQTVKLPNYRKKQKDINKIKRAFEKAKINNNWFPHSISGKKVLSLITTRILTELDSDQFTWLAFSNSIDSLLLHLLRECKNAPNSPVEIYLRVITDLLSYLYCLMLFCETENEANEVLDASLIKFREIFVTDLTWPEDLDKTT